MVVVPPGRLAMAKLPATSVTVVWSGPNVGVTVTTVPSGTAGSNPVCVLSPSRSMNT